MPTIPGTHWSTPITWNYFCITCFVFIKQLKNNQETAFKFESYLNNKYVGQYPFHWISSITLLRQHKTVSLWQHLSSWEYPWWKGNFSWRVACLSTFFTNQSHQSRHTEHGGTEECSCTALVRIWRWVPQGSFINSSGEKWWSSGLKNIARKVFWCFWKGILQGFKSFLGWSAALCLQPYSWLERARGWDSAQGEGGEGSFPRHKTTPQPLQTITAQPGLLPGGLVAHTPGPLSGSQRQDCSVSSYCLPGKKKKKKKKKAFSGRSSLWTNGAGYSRGAASLFQLCRMLQRGRQPAASPPALLPLIHGCQRIKLLALPSVWSRCCLARGTIWYRIWSISFTAIYSN